VHVWLSWGVEISAGVNFSLFVSDPLPVGQSDLGSVGGSSWRKSRGRAGNSNTRPHPGPTRSPPSNPFTSRRDLASLASVSRNTPKAAR